MLSILFLLLFLAHRFQVILVQSSCSYFSSQLIPLSTRIAQSRIKILQAFIDRIQVLEHGAILTYSPGKHPTKPPLDDNGGKLPVYGRRGIVRPPQIFIFVPVVVSALRGVVYAVVLSLGEGREQVLGNFIMPGEGARATQVVSSLGVLHEQRTAAYCLVAPLSEPES